MKPRTALALLLAASSLAPAAADPAGIAVDDRARITCRIGQLQHQRLFMAFEVLAGRMAPAAYSAATANLRLVGSEEVRSEFGQEAPEYAFFFDDWDRMTAELERFDGNDAVAYIRDIGETCEARFND